MDDFSTDYSSQGFSSDVDDALARIYKAMKNPGQLPGLSTGLKVLDEAIDGLQKTHLITLGAATGMGKTSFAVNVASNIAKSHPVGFLSLEQPASELVLRILSDALDRDMGDLKKGFITEHEIEAMHEIIAALKQRQLYIKYVLKRDLDNVRDEAAKLVDNFGIEALFVDYLQLAKGKDTRTRDREIGEITGKLKETAVELDIPIVMLSQLNREVQRQDGNRPNLSNMRESGSIEMDSDVVLLLHRDYYYFKQKKAPDIFDQAEYQKHQQKKLDLRGKADLIVAKNRHGPSGQVLKLAFNEQRMRFSDLASDQEIPQ